MKNLQFNGYYVEFTLFAHWTSYFINADASGYEDQDIEEIKEFENEMLATYKTFHCAHADVENTYFKHSNDASSLGGDVCKFVFQVTN